MRTTMTRTAAVTAAAFCLLLTAACGSSGGSKSSGASAGAGNSTPGKVPLLAASDIVTRGPNGEQPVAGATLQPTAAQVAQIKAKKYTAAIIWDAQTTFFSAVSQGARSVFTQLGIKVVAESQYNFDLNLEKQQVETIVALHPSVLLTIADDPVISAQAMQPAIAAGIKVVLLSTMPKGWSAGNQYISMVTGDQAGMGIGDAKALADSIGDSGEIGVLYHDASYFVTNRRDQAFVTEIVRSYPKIKIVAEQGFTTPDQAEALTNAMLVQHPNIKGLYAAWDAVTESALSASVPAGLKVVSMDLGANTAKNLGSCGQIKAIAVEQTYSLGTTMATAASLGLIGAQVPAFLTVPAQIIKHDTLASDWVTTLHNPVPSSVTSAYKQTCPS